MRRDIAEQASVHTVTHALMTYERRSRSLARIPRATKRYSVASEHTGDSSRGFPYRRLFADAARRRRLDPERAGPVPRHAAHFDDDRAAALRRRSARAFAHRARYRTPGTGGGA